MEIVVCIKQVPENTEVKINPKTNTLMREGVKGIINPFDMYAIEEALRVKENRGGKVTVLTMGPPQAEESLREAISLGCDEAILVSDRAFAGSDTLATSYTLAKAIEKIGHFDLIFCGKQAMDGDTAQVGPGIATLLDIPQVTFVKKIAKIENDKLQVERMIEEGFEVISAPLPCLLTVVKEINTPRLPSLKGKMRAKSVQVKMWTSKDLNVEHGRLGLEGSPTWVIKVFNPEPRHGGQVFHGEPEELVEKLFGIIREEINKCA
jgi:electron transfer flavoprotein beta subunit